PAASLKIPVAITLGALGIWRLVRHSHFSGGGMQVGMWRLTGWSFLMATCHGAGLMVLPVFAGMAAPARGESCHTPGAAAGATARLLHGVGYLIVTALVAWVVFTRVGVGILRRAWFNLDLLWAMALIVTGALTLVL